MSASPLVSVLMTAFNRAKFIGAAIESVLSSTYRNFELIIVDDCSKDKTLSIAEGFQGKDSRIKVFKNEHNLGDYSNRNKAAGYATGDFMMYTDSDDLLLPESIEKCVKLTQMYPDLNFALYYPEQGIENPYFINPQDAVKRQFFKNSFLQMGPGGIFIRRLFFQHIGGFCAKYGPASDMYFNIKAASLSDALILPFPLVFYRRHENQELNDTYSYIYNNYRCSRDIIYDLNLPLTRSEQKFILKKNKRRFAVNAFNYFRKSGNLQKTKDLFRKADFTFKDLIEGVFH